MMRNNRRMSRNYRSVETEKEARPKISAASVRRLLVLVKPYWLRLMVAGVAMLVGSLIGLIFPAVTSSLIDTIFIKRDEGALNNIVLLLMVVFVGQAAFIYLQSYLVSWVGERVVADLRLKLYNHLQKLSISFFNEHRTGELISRFTNDVTTVQSAVTNNLISFFQNIVTLVGAIFIIIITDLRLTLLILAVVPIIVVTAILFGRWLRGVSNKVQTQIGETTAVLEETVANIRTVKAFSRENYEIERYQNGVQKIFNITISATRIRSLFTSTMTVVSFEAIVAVLWYGGHEVLAGSISPGQLVAFLIYMGIVGGQVGSLSGVYGTFQSALGGSQRIFELLDTTPQIVDQPDACILPPIKGDLRFDDVSFSYSESGAAVLHNLSFRAAPGEVVALVGPSGAGKTTTVSLIPRFYDVNAGSITVDGYDIKNVTSQSLREQIGIVPQEPVLFGMSVRENILYGRLDATPAEVEAAAKAANAHEFIVRLAEGYDSLVGERGVKLSSGQRQRIAIARAILRNPRILILDEATSALDNESESLVQEALERLMQDRTTIVIAHRLTTIEKADKIVVMEQGRLVEEGSHAELLLQEGLYYRLYTRNFEQPVSV
jgi:subfamily B ATP-binding cassette protein MsbA